MFNFLYKIIFRFRSVNIPILIFFFFCFNIPLSNAQCPVPSGLTSSQITNTSVQLSWASTPADSFLLRYYDNSDSIYLFQTISNGSATSITVSGLTPNTTYSWLIRTWCLGGTSGSYQSTPSVFITDSQPVSCVTPNNTVHSNLTTNSADLSWNSFVYADSFMVRYAEYNTSNYTWVVVPGSQHSMTIYGLQPNVQYEWVVRCICAGNPNQAYSRTKVFTTPGVACDAADVAWFTSNDVTANSATVGWNAVTNAVSYNIRYAVRFSGVWLSTTSTNLTAALSALQPSTWYEFQIQTVCANGSSVWSPSGIFETFSNIVYLTRGPYLQLSTQTSIYIRWRTDVPCDSKINFGTNPANLNLSTTNTSPTTEHVVNITGLTKGTKYYYSIGTSAMTLQGDQDNYFVTNPDVGSTTPVRIWAIGDFGRSSNEQRAVRDAYETYSGNTHTNVWLWLGDNAYEDGTDSEYQTKVFNEYPRQFKKWVTWPTSGNHDLHTANSANQSGPYYDNFTMPTHGEAGGLASNTEAYYSFDYANIHFVCLESYDAAYRATNGDMVAWLDNDLAANSQTFTIVFFHHPPYSKGSHNSDSEIELIEMRSNIVPILENYKVDLVLCGHSHAYERSMMLHGHYGNSGSFDISTMATDPGSGIFPNSYVKNGPGAQGTLYVVCGTSGLAGTTSSGWPHPVMYSASVNHFGSMVIDIQGNELSCKYLTSTGIIYDEFTLVKPGFPTTGVDVHPASVLNTLSIWPNPVLQNAIISYHLKKAASIRFDVFDPAGRLVYTMGDDVERSSGVHTINFPARDANLPRGIYFIRMIAGEDLSIGKILID